MPNGTIPLSMTHLSCPSEQSCTSFEAAHQPLPRCKFLAKARSVAKCLKMSDFVKPLPSLRIERAKRRYQHWRLGTQFENAVTKP